MFSIAPALVLQLAQELRTVELRADDPALAGHGPARVVELTIEADGFLDLWAESTTIDAFLRVEDPDGKLRAEGDDSARAGRPWIALEVESGMKLVVRVASTKPEIAGMVELHINRWTTSEEELELLARSETGIAEAKDAHATGDLPAARGRAWRRCSRRCSWPERAA